MCRAECETHGVEWFARICSHLNSAFEQKQVLAVSVAVDEERTAFFVCEQCASVVPAELEQVCSRCFKQWARRGGHSDLSQQIRCTLLRVRAEHFIRSIDGSLERWRWETRHLPRWVDESVRVALMPGALAFIADTGATATIELATAERVFAQLRSRLAEEPRVDLVRRERRSGDVRLIWSRDWYALAWNVSARELAIENPQQRAAFGERALPWEDPRLTSRRA